MKVGEYHQDRNSIYYVKSINKNSAEILYPNGRIAYKDIEIAKRINNKISLEIDNTLNLIFSNIDEAYDYLDSKNISYGNDNVFKVLSKATKIFINDNPEYNKAEYLYKIKDYCFGFNIPLIKFNNIKWIRLYLWAEHNKWEWPITLSSNNHEIWYSTCYGHTGKEDRKYIDMNEFDILKKIHHIVLMHDYRGKRFQFDEYHCRLNDSKNKNICFIKIEKPVDELEREKNRQEALMWIEKYEQDK